MLSARPIIFVVTTECKLILFGFVSINTTFKENVLLLMPVQFGLV